MSVFVMFVCGKMAFCTQMELLIMWISWEDSLNVVAAAWGGNALSLPGWRKKKIFPLEVSAPQSSQVCKAFTSQRYSLIFIKIRYN